MFKIEFENWMMIHEAITNDFGTALEDLAVAIDDETANGHIIDAETGEVLVQITEGNVVYIAHDVLMEMIGAIGEEDPEIAMAMTLMAMAFGV